MLTARRVEDQSRRPAATVPSVQAGRLSVVVPAHNEESYLEAAVYDLVTGLRTWGRKFELIICENGSTDLTRSRAEKLSDDYAEVSSLSSERPDYGRALHDGFDAATGDVVANFDVDYIDLQFLHAALALMDAPGGPAAVVASKRGAGSDDTRPAGRRLVTLAFSQVLRFGFGLGVTDTHGMKVLNRRELAPIVATCKFGADLFDTELILRAERAGLSVAELPVSVRDTRPPRTPITRRLPRAFAGLARLRVALWQETLAGRASRRKRSAPRSPRPR